MTWYQPHSEGVNLLLLGSALRNDKEWRSAFEEDSSLPFPLLLCSEVLWGKRRREREDKGSLAEACPNPLTWAPNGKAGETTHAPSCLHWDLMSCISEPRNIMPIMWSQIILWIMTNIDLPLIVLQSFAGNLQVGHVGRVSAVTVSFPQTTAAWKESSRTKASLSLKLGFNLQRLMIYYSALRLSTFGDNTSFLTLVTSFL